MSSPSYDFFFFLFLVFLLSIPKVAGHPFFLHHFSSPTTHSTPNTHTRRDPPLLLPHFSFFFSFPQLHSQPKKPTFPIFHGQLFQHNRHRHLHSPLFYSSSIFLALIYFIFFSHTHTHSLSIRHPHYRSLTANHCTLAIRSSMVVQKIGKFHFYHVRSWECDVCGCGLRMGGHCFTSSFTLFTLSPLHIELPVASPLSLTWAP